MGKVVALIALAAALAVCLTPTVSQAAVVFNTFPADELSSWIVANQPWYDAIACQFTVTGSDYTLESIAFGLKWLQAGSSVVLSLMADNGNSVGTVLARETVGSDSTSSTVLTVETLFGTGIRLNKDTSYWVALEPGAAGTRVGWHYGTNSVGRVYSDWGWGWFDPSFPNPQLGAFTVRGTPVEGEVVPEPSALILALLGGSGAMGGMLLRRRK